mgnify:CR=1 FL=1
MNALRNAALLIALLPGAAQAAAAGSTARDGWDFNLPPAELRSLCETTLDTARDALRAIEGDTQAATLASVYGAYNDMNIALQRIRHVWYVKAVHPDTAVQAAAEDCSSQYSDFATQAGLSRPLYERFAAIDQGTLTEAERLMLQRKLREFRQVGIDRDDATRQQVRDLIAQITELGNQFDRNIREDRRAVTARPEQLRGLPQDFLDDRAIDDNGLITLSTDYPDLFPVMKYSQDDALRQKLYIASMNIATPANNTVLEQLLQKRFELARLLGYANYAALAMDGLMIETPARAEAFLSEVGAAAQLAAGKDLQVLLQRLRRIDPDASELQPWQASFVANLVREETYAVDARAIREYFHFDKVQKGVFQLTEALFGVQIIPWQTTTWHEDVTAWEIREKGTALGRFYLDMHPRDNKYKHAAHWTLRTGLSDRQLPLSGMAMNFPRGLMEHTQVETFLHEFGHLLHNMFSGTQQWLDISGMSMESDFVEAPSQMLEEWIWDYATLSQFATNADNQVIPREMVAGMNRARHFGQALGTASQLYYASVSLDFYNADPGSFELLPKFKALTAQYSPFDYIEGTHFYNMFGHLNGYSSNYYTYQWSQAIATDLLTRFNRAGLRDRATAAAYRNTVLAPGGSKPAMQLIEDFLGRPFSTQAYIEQLESLAADTAPAAEPTSRAQGY